LPNPVPSIARSSSSWVFAASLSTFHRCRLSPQGLPVRESPWQIVRITGAAHMSLFSPSKRPKTPEVCPPQLPATSLPASRGIHSSRVPFIRHHPCASAFQRRCCHRSSANRSTPIDASILVVSHHLDGLFRARAFGPIASRSRKGFAAFLLPPPPLPPPCLRRDRLGLVRTEVR
jgi:hypothetical protein